MDEFTPLTQTKPAADAAHDALASASPDKTSFGKTKMALLVGSVVGMAGFVAVATRSSGQEQAQASAVDIDFKAYNGDQYCDTYDDDSVFTAALCGENDSGMCGTVCPTTGCSNTTCMDNFWCSELCGDSCEEGDGAVCFFESLQDMETTCTKVQVIINNSTETSGYSAEQLEEMLEYPYVGESADFFEENAIREGYGPHDDVSDLGCGTHAWCEYCSGDCNSTAMSTFAYKEFGNTKGLDINPTYAKYVLNDILVACDFFNYTVISPEGRPLDGTPLTN